jgi:cystathionine beta-lyase/cystathionine gamma-synthase
MRLGGTVMAVEVVGGFEACQSLVSQLQVVRIATSFGGPETLVCNPATSTHVGLSQEALTTMGVSDGLLRFSIGLEDVDDLVDDIHRALASA